MKILLADDHPIFRKGLKALIEDHYAKVLVSECDNGQEAIDLLENQGYSVAIIDIDMPLCSGIEVLRFLKIKKMKVKPIILTMHNDELFFNEAFDQGALGFLLKEDSSLELITCIGEVLDDRQFVSNKLKSFLDNRKQFGEKIGGIRKAIKSLTNAEINTLKLVAENHTSKEIAELLFVTEKSVENYRSRICRKLNLSGGSNTLYKWCVENKELIK